MNAPKPWGGFDEWTVEDIRSLQAGLEAELAKRSVGRSSLRVVPAPPTGARNLTWTDGRWHHGETPIHAGSPVRVRVAETGTWNSEEGRFVAGGAGPWFPMRVESHDEGRVLLGFYEPPKGPTFVVTIGPDHELELL